VPFSAFKELPSLKDGLHDRKVPRASAKMPGYDFSYSIFVRLGFVAQQGVRRHKNSRRAETALDGTVLAERLLQRSELVVVRNALDCLYGRMIGLHGKHQARPNRQAVDDYSARTAKTVGARNMGSSQLSLVSQAVSQRCTRLYIKAVLLAVDFHVGPHSAAIPDR